MTVIRELIDGGMSECSSDKEHLGKGRCRHILGKLQPMILRRIGRNEYDANIKKEKDISIKHEKEAIKNYFSALPKIPKAKQNTILKSLEVEGML